MAVICVSKNILFARLLLEPTLHGTASLGGGQDPAVLGDPRTCYPELRWGPAISNTPTVISASSQPSYMD